MGLLVAMFNEIEMSACAQCKRLAAMFDDRLPKYSTPISSRPEIWNLRWNLVVDRSINVEIDFTDTNVNF